MSTARALVLTYHAVEDGAGPLRVSPGLLAAHLDAIVASGADTVTIAELAEALRTRSLSRPAVAITFDDGAASVARTAAPLLAERGIRATVFCVAGHLGLRSDWPSARPGPTFELATAAELTDLAASGWEIGAHGMTHAPLTSDDGPFLTREVVDAAAVLEDAVGSKVTSLAFPYGAQPSPEARRLVASRYGAACTTSLAMVDAGADTLALPRVDAHYVRRLRLLRGALDGSLGVRLRTLRLGARARRIVRADFLQHTETKGQH
jgi:peptidoglycan/xylan/chitin deacetylase (PgdA/CDA1 family)